MLEFPAEKATPGGSQAWLTHATLPAPRLGAVGSRGQWPPPEVQSQSTWTLGQPQSLPDLEMPECYPTLPNRDPHRAQTLSAARASEALPPGSGAATDHAATGYAATAVGSETRLQGDVNSNPGAVT